MPKTAKRAIDNRKQKEELARYRNSFIQNLAAFLDDAIGEELCSYIPDAEWQKMFNYRATAIRIRAAEGHNIPSAMLKSWGSTLRSLQENAPVSVNIGNITELNLQEYFLFHLTLMTYAGQLKSDSFVNANMVYHALQHFRDYPKVPSFTEALEQLYRNMHTLCVVDSNLQQTLYGATQALTLHKDGDGGVGYVIFMHALKPETIWVNLRDHSRIAYRIGFSNYQCGNTIDYVSIASENLFLPKGEHLPVYIQSHALQRLAERLDGLPTAGLNIHLYYSFKMPVKAIRFKGSLLIPYCIYAERAGYFTGEIVDGQLILTTFLFLTNNNTPEGEELYKQYELTRADKDYLAINKLSSFVASDIAQNPEAKALFIKAGCESLFRIEKSNYMYLPDEKQLGEALLKYLVKDC